MFVAQREVSNFVCKRRLWKYAHYWLFCASLLLLCLREILNSPDIKPTAILYNYVILQLQTRICIYEAINYQVAADRETSFSLVVFLF